MLIAKLGVPSLLLIVTIALTRLLLVVEVPHVYVITSRRVFPFIQSLLTHVLIDISGFTMTIGIGILITAGVVAIAKLVILILRNKREMDYYKNLLSDDTSFEQEVLADILPNRRKRARVRIIKAEDIDSPRMSGILAPTIYLPAQQYTYTQAYYTLKHELTHFNNKDTLYSLFAGIICAVLWWNPFVYLLRKDIDRTLELNCDYSMIKDSNSRERDDYLQTLLDAYAARKSKYEKTIDSEQSVMGILGIRAESAIEQRFALVIAFEKRTKKHQIVFGLVLMAGLMLFVLSYGFVVQPWYEPPGMMTLDHQDYIPEYAVLFDDDYYMIYCEDGISFKVNAETYQQMYLKLPLREE